MRRITIVCLLLCFYRLAAAPQSPSAPDDPHKSDVPTIVVNSEEVSLDLLIHDRKGKPVTDLTPSDLQIYDGGSAVKLSELQLISGTATTDHLLSLVFDHMDDSSSENARGVAEKILDLTPEGGVLFSVMRVEGRLLLFHDFTGNRELLRSAVRSASVGPPKHSTENPSKTAETLLISQARKSATASPNAAATAQATRARMLLTGLEDSQRIVRDQHAAPSLAALLALVRAQKEVPGRKAIVFFTQGHNFDSNARDLVRTIVGEANRARVSIYTIDTNPVDPEIGAGLVTALALGRGSEGTMPSMSRPASQPAGDTGGTGSQAIAAQQSARVVQDGLLGHHNPLEQVSLDSGGLYIGANENLKKALQRLVQDVSTYYRATYIPPPHLFDGAFRAVAVRSLRRGVFVRGSAGYYATRPGGDAAIQPFESPLHRALMAPVLPNDVSFATGVLRLGELSEGSTNTVVVEVPLQQMEIHEDRNTSLYSFHLSLLAQIRNASGAVVEHFSEDIPSHGALERLDAVRRTVLTFQRHFMADPGKYVLETAVQDENSGKIGAQRQQFETVKAAGRVELSDLALVRRTEKLTADADPAEPLVYENSKIVPNLSGKLAPAAKEASLFFIIHEDPKSQDPARVELKVFRNGREAAHGPIGLRQTQAEGAIPYMARIGGRSLPPGHYSALVTLTQGGYVSERKLAFTAEGQPDANHPARTTTSSRAEQESEATDLPTPKDALVITHPKISIPPPDAAETQAMLHGVREGARNYLITLPNFTCLQVTERSTANRGGAWRRKDSFVELLRYRNKTEERVVMEVNGKRSGLSRSDLKGTLSHGAFGGILNAIFAPEAKAEIQWKDTAMLGQQTVQVFAYRVGLQNSSFGLTDDDNRQINVGFHGLFYVEPATYGIRRITMEADLPSESFSIRATSLSVDYDYVAIASHDWLICRSRRGSALSNGSASPF